MGYDADAVSFYGVVLGEEDLYEQVPVDCGHNPPKGANFCPKCGEKTGKEELQAVQWFKDAFGEETTWSEEIEFGIYYANYDYNKYVLGFQLAKINNRSNDERVQVLDHDFGMLKRIFENKVKELNIPVVREPKLILALQESC